MAIDLQQYYAEQYRREVSHKAGPAATDARELFAVYSPQQRDRLRFVEPHLNSSTRVLELGASAGQFLYHLKDRVARADAIEFDWSCCEFIRQELGLRADSNELRKSAFVAERYDVVCAFQVLEHVVSPVDFLRDIRDVLADRGVAFIEVPNLHDPLLSVWNVPAYQTFYYHAQHPHYFTERSVRKVAHLAGFDAAEIQIDFIQDYNVLNHLHWILNDAPQPTCEIGLNPIRFSGRDTKIVEWLTHRVRTLNEEYVQMLVDARTTSNLMMTLRGNVGVRV